MGGLKRVAQLCGGLVVISGGRRVRYDGKGRLISDEKLEEVYRKMARKVRRRRKKGK